MELTPCIWGVAPNLGKDANLCDTTESQGPKMGLFSNKFSANFCSQLQMVITVRKLLGSVNVSCGSF